MPVARNTCEELSGLCEAARDTEGETVRIVCKVGLGYFYREMGYGKWINEGGLNPSNLTSSCSSLPICYHELALVEKYLNSLRLKHALHIPKFKNFSSVDSDVSQAFEDSGDGATDYPKQIIERGVGVLMYNRNLDVIVRPRDAVG